MYVYWIISRYTVYYYCWNTVIEGTRHIFCVIHVDVIITIGYSHKGRVRYMCIGLFLDILLLCEYSNRRNVTFILDYSC